MHKRSGFTLVDLLVIVVLLMFVAAVVVPAAYQQSWGRSDRIKCASNLRQIGLAMKMYANDETRTNSYPRTIYVKDAPPTQFTSPNSNDPFNGFNKPAPNDVTAAVFLLLRTQDITTDVFVCPSTNFVPFDALSQPVQQFSNFTATNQLSYSFQNPYPTSAAVSNGFQYNDSMTADFALAADINPGVPELTTTPISAAGRAINSPNHGKDGQNVLYADGHCEWQSTPFTGVQTDNIYTFGPNPAQAHPDNRSPIGIVGSPINGNDSILLPTFDTSLPDPSIGGGAFVLLAIGAGVLIILAGVGVLLYFLLKKPNTPTPPTPPPLPMGG